MYGKLKVRTSHKAQSMFSHRCNSFDLGGDLRTAFFLQAKLFFFINDTSLRIYMQIQTKENENCSGIHACAKNTICQKEKIQEILSFQQASISAFVPRRFFFQHFCLHDKSGTDSFLVDVVVCWKCFRILHMKQSTAGHSTSSHPAALAGPKFPGQKKGKQTAKHKSITCNLSCGLAISWNSYCFGTDFGLS